MNCKSCKATLVGAKNLHYRPRLKLLMLCFIPLAGCSLSLILSAGNPLVINFTSDTLLSPNVPRCLGAVPEAMQYTNPLTLELPLT